jgi:hypothetical protein
MGFFDSFFGGQGPAVPHSAARKAVYAHRLSELREKIKSAGLPARARDSMVFGFVIEFLGAFFGADAKGAKDFEAQVEASGANEAARGRAVSLYRRMSQYRSMGMELGKSEADSFLADCGEILSSA